MKYSESTCTMHVLDASMYYKSFEIGFINSMDVLICLGKKVSLLLLHLMHAQIGSQLALKCACQRLDQILVLPKYLTAGSRASWDMFMSSCTLFWDDSIKIWDENLLLFTFLTGKLTKNLFWTNKKFVYLLSFLSQNIVPK